MENVVMNFKNIKLMCASLLLICGNASATLMTFETRDLDHDAANHGIDKLDYAGSWLAQASDINSVELSDFTMIKSGKDRISHLQIDLSIDRDLSNWFFELGLDAGFGAAVYLDGNLVDNRTDDLWWGYNWNNSDVFSVALNGLTRDNKVVDIYWGEHCCNGASSIRFKNDFSQWGNLSASNLADASIPEPTSIALIAMGLLGLVSRRFSK